MKLLVIGATGQLGGQMLAAATARGHQVIGTGTGPHAQVQLHLQDEAATRTIIHDLAPDAVLLPAAYAHVDGCEADPTRCQLVNVVGPTVVTLACQQLDIPLLFVSTAHVFSDAIDAHTEDDPVAPINVYSRAKVAAEVIVRRYTKHLIIRTDGVFGPDPNHKHFAARVWRTLQRAEPLMVPNDQWGQPTYGPDLARVSIKLLERAAWGTWHACGPQLLRRDLFARQLAELACLDTAQLRAIPTTELGQTATRPLRVELNRQKLCTFFGSDPIRPALDGARELLTSSDSPLDRSET